MKAGTFGFPGNYAFLAIFLVTVSMPFWLPSYFLGIASLALVFIGLSSAWNIVAGIAGQMSLGHSLFVGLGALLSSALLIHLGINMWLGMLISAAVSALLSAFIAWIDFRFKLSHLSFALITLAFGEMGELAFVGTEFLGGASGLSLPPDKGDFLQFQFGGERGGFYVLLITAGMCVLSNLLILNSRLGYHLRAMRDNENAAQAMGVNLLRSKIVAMMISAVLTSIVGTVYARYSGFVDPYQMASPHSSVEVVLFTTIGGLGTVLGPVLGAGVLVAFGEIVRGYVGGILPGLHFLITGVLIVVVILLVPSGLVPRIAELWRERKSRTGGAGALGTERLPVLKPKPD
jgi:branched-chain amino acid transport system permease protein